MKKSLLALAVLAAFATGASAQSSVRITGIIDAGVGKAVGSADKGVIDGLNGNGAGNGSRLAFLGNEDLGGGNSAIFGFETRFTSVNGQSPTPFWQGYSWVGLRSTTLGTLQIGRQYNAAFIQIQNAVDPFGGQTIAALRQTATQIGGIAAVRVDNSLGYTFSQSGLTVAATIAEAIKGDAFGGTKRPTALAAKYAAGPFWVGVGYERNSADGKETTLAGAYNFGVANVSASYTTGKTGGTNLDRKAYLIGADIPVGPGSVKVGYAQLKGQLVAGGANDTRSSKLGLGYHYPLSKRTKLYVDVANDSKLNSEKSGYDLGIQHQF